MRRPLLGFLLGTLVLASGGMAAISEPQPAVAPPDPLKLLTADDVMRLSGGKDLRALPRDLKEGAVADVTFIRPDGQFVAALTVQKQELFDRWAKFHRKAMVKFDGLGESSFGRSVVVPAEGAGQEKAEGTAPVREIAALYVRQNGVAFSVCAFVARDGTITLSPGQLEAITRVVTGRLAERQAKIEADAKAALEQQQQAQSPSPASQRS